MLKQKKQMILILALLLVFGGAYAGMRLYNQKQSEKEAEEAEAAKIYVTNENQEEIMSFSYQKDGEELSFVKEGGGWTLEKDRELTLDQSAVEAIAEKLSSVEAEAYVESPEDLSEYGMDSPQNVITFTTKEGGVTLTVGMQNPVTSQYYLTKSGDDALYLLGSGFLSSFEKSAEELLAEEESTPKEPQETEEE